MSNSPAKAVMATERVFWRMISEGEEHGGSTVYRDDTLSRQGLIDGLKLEVQKAYSAAELNVLLHQIEPRRCVIAPGVRGFSASQCPDVFSGILFEPTYWTSAFYWAHADDVKQQDGSFPPGFELRPINGEEARQVHETLRRSKDDTKDPEVGKSLLDLAYRRLQREDYSSYALFCGITPIGTISCLSCDDGLVRFRDLFLLDRYRGKEYPLMMVSHVVRQHPARAYCVATDLRNTARRTYEKCGLRFVHALESYDFKFKSHSQTVPIKPQSVVNKKIERKLGESLLGRLEVVRRTYLTVEDLVSSEILRWNERASNGEIASAHAEHEMSQLAVNCTTLHRHGALCSICASLEDSLAEICASIDLDQPKRKKGSWLDKRISSLARDAGTNPDQILQHVETFNHFLRLRNCIAHRLGNIEGARRVKDTRDSIRLLCKKDEEIVIETNYGPSHKKCRIGVARNYD